MYLGQNGNINQRSKSSAWRTHSRCISWCVYAHLLLLFIDVSAEAIPVLDFFQFDSGFVRVHTLPSLGI